ncbi:MAG: hypothetical protein AB1405_04145 [Bdellovibrionota bacterium]
MKRHLALPLFFLLLNACTLGDDTPPSAPDEFVYDPSSRTFTWVASGDDGTGGNNFFNDIRFSDREPSNLDNASFDGLAFFHHQVGEGFPRLFKAELVEPPSLPEEEKYKEFFVARRPDPTAYLTPALQVRDEVSNASAVVPADLDPGPATDNSPVGTNLAQLTLDATTFGALDASGDLNGDRLSDLVVVDADPGSERMYVYMGRSAFPFFAADLESGAEPDPSSSTPGNCAAGPGRFCAPDIVVDLSALDPLNTGSVGGRSAFAVGQGLPPRTLSVGDLTGDGLAEIVVGAPEFTPVGESQERGAAFVFSFHETLVSTKAGEESLFFLYNPADRPASPAPIRTYLGKTVDAGPEGLVVEDLLCQHCSMPFDNDGVEIDAPASEKQEWRLYDSEPVQVFPVSTCSVPRCTGADLLVTNGSPYFDSESADFEGLEGEFLLVIYDGAGDPDFAAVVERFDPSRPVPTDPVDSGFRGRIVIDWRRASKPLAGLATAANRPFALFRQIAEGERFETNLSSGSLADPLLIGNLRKRYDAADEAATLRTIIDPTDLADVPGPGEERPFATLLGPEADGRFGEAVATAGDMNLDGTQDLAVSAPGLDTLPSRYGTFATHADRGGVMVLYGDEDFPVLDVPLPGGFPDGVYDFGPLGEDRPQAIILGRDAGDLTGSSLAAARVRGDRPETDARGEHALVVAALAVGAPGANPSPVYYYESMGLVPFPFGCGVDLNGVMDGTGSVDADEDERDNAGAVYLFAPHREFEARDYWPLGGLPDGVYDLDDDTPLCDVASAEIWGEVANDRLGTSVVLDLDANGDHVLDLAVGAPGWNGGVGQVYVFLGTTREATPPAFTQFDPASVGAIPSGGSFSFFNRGNVDADRRVDDDENESLIDREDRCVLCLYDLSRSFTTLPSELAPYAAGPDLIVEGGADAAIGLNLSAGFLDPDGFEDILLLANGAGDWPLFLSGMTSLLVEYRQLGTALPGERPHPANYVDEGNPGDFIEAPGNAAAAGGVLWWVERDTIDSRVGKLGQAKVEVQVIYEATDETDETPIDHRVFGRSYTDDSVEDSETQSTVQLEFINRDDPDRVFRWNALTTGGLFPALGTPDTPFASSLDVFSFGGDATGDGQEDLLFCAEGGEIRVVY